jgi:hypothetical protein
MGRLEVADQVSDCTYGFPRILLVKFLGFLVFNA